MTIVTAITHPHGAASALHTGTHWFAIGLLVGLVVAVTPAIVKVPVIVFDIVALGWSFGILDYIDHTRSGIPWVFIALAFLLAGMAWGVIRGLRHLGDAEYVGRLGNIRRLGRWF
jgi:hypothetical protein